MQRPIITALIAGLLGPAAFAVNIDLVTVGDPGNTQDTRYGRDHNGNPDDLPGYGSVAYTYQIGKFDVTAGDYCSFLNAVAKTDTYGLYSASMDVIVNSWGCNIKRSGSSGHYTYAVGSNWANRPVNCVSWGDAARFCNWLTNGQRVGDQGPLTTEDGSYALNGETDVVALLAVTRKQGARYVIPTEDEWYKAAYYDPNKPGGAGYWDYATKSNVVPSNVLDPNGTNNANYNYTIGAPYNRTEVGAFAHSPSAYGTFDQSGNIWQWNEAVLLNYYMSHVLRGGGFHLSSEFLSASTRAYCGAAFGGEDTVIGFRVAYIPEPSTLALLAVGGIAVIQRRRAANHPTRSSPDSSSPGRSWACSAQ